MNGATIEEEYQLFQQICLDSDTDEDSTVDYENVRETPLRLRPRPPPEPTKPIVEKYIDFEKYLQENYGNRIKILNRSTFHLIQRPIILFFNHFREKCFYHTEWLDRFYKVSLKYGDRIEFIAADQMDMDLMYPHTNPINFFCYLISPEDESPCVYAIDETKQICEYFDAYKTVENLSKLCENLLDGSLYISQAIPEKQETLVKVCVHSNYNDIVTNSTQDTFLIVGLGIYIPCEENEPNYEQMAEEFQTANIQIVYIDGHRNYVPFKFNANSYPTLLFIPHEDQEDFIRYDRGPRDTENVRDFLQKNMGSQGKHWRQIERMKLQYKPFRLPKGNELHVEELNVYIKDNFPNSIHVLDRNSFRTIKKCIIITFMDFKGHGIKFYLPALQNLYQVAESKYIFGVEYIIADLQDIDILYPTWYEQYMEDLQIDSTIPQVYAIDRMKNARHVDPFKTAASIFYYSYHLIYSGLFHSQPVTVSETNSDKVKTCVAQNLKPSIEQSKIDVFLTIYWGTYRDSNKILNVLEEIADEATCLNVKMIKMDAKLNFVPLEYTYSKYPVHFFITRHNMNDERTIRYISLQQSKDDIFGFIRRNARNES